jgi:hypothetical protein
MKSPCERIPFIKLQTQSKLYSISTHSERERNVIGCVVFIIHIIVVFHLLTFIVCNMWGVEES